MYIDDRWSGPEKRSLLPSGELQEIYSQENYVDYSACCFFNRNIYVFDSGVSGNKCEVLVLQENQEIQRAEFQERFSVAELYKKIKDELNIAEKNFQIIGVNIESDTVHFFNGGNHLNRQCGIISVKNWLSETPEILGFQELIPPIVDNQQFYYTHASSLDNRFFALAKPPQNEEDHIDVQVDILSINSNNIDLSLQMELSYDPMGIFVYHNKDEHTDNLDFCGIDLSTLKPVEQSFFLLRSPQDPDFTDYEEVKNYLRLITLTGVVRYDEYEYIYDEEHRDVLFLNVLEHFSEMEAQTRFYAADLILRYKYDDPTFNLTLFKGFAETIVENYDNFELMDQIMKKLMRRALFCHDILKAMAERRKIIPELISLAKESLHQDFTSVRLFRKIYGQDYDLKHAVKNYIMVLEAMN